MGSTNSARAGEGWFPTLFVDDRKLKAVRKQGVHPIPRMEEYFSQKIA